MTFLNTAILLGLLGVTLPVLIHLFARQKVKRIVFSTTVFLQQIQSKTMRRLRLRQLILLILRCLIILFLVLVFARPAIRSAMSRSGVSSSALAIIVDQSMSMNRNNLFEKGMARIRSILALLNPQDEVVIIPTLGTQNEEMNDFQSQAAAVRELNRKNPTEERGNYTKAIHNAIEKLAESTNINREIYLVTDLQESNFSPQGDSTSTAESEEPIFILPVLGETDNVAVTDGGIENTILQPNAPLHVFAQIQNFGQEDIEELLVRVSVRGDVVAQRVIRIEKGETQRVVFQIAPTQGGWLWGSISLETDVLLNDNVFYFSSKIPNQISVLLVGKRIIDNKSIQLALAESMADEGLYQVFSRESSGDWLEDLESFDVLILSNLERLGPVESNRIEKFVNNGGGLIIFVGENVDLRNINDHFFVPVLKARLGNIVGSRTRDKGYLTFQDIEYNHPLFQGLFEKGKERIHSPRIYRATRLLGSGFYPIITMSGGMPFLAEIPAERGKVFAIMTGIDPGWSNLVYSTFFAPLVSRCVSYAATPVSDDFGSFVVGSPVTVSLAQNDLDGIFRVTDPVERETLVIPEFQAGQMRLTHFNPEIPGLYRFYRNESLVGMRAVNVDPVESNLKAVELEEISNYLPGSTIRVVQPNENLENIVHQSRYGQEFWKLLAIICLTLLFVEMMIAREKRKSQSQE